MRLWVDNLDGLGAVDYSETIDRSSPVSIKRTLNAPSIARLSLCLEGSAARVPVRRARVVLSSDGAETLFTGYLALEPVAVYAGAATRGPVYRLELNAVSDEWLLDKQAGATPGVGLGESGGVLLQRLAARLGTGTGALETGSVAGVRALGVFVPESAATWSRNAGAVANAAYAAYRASAGVLSLTPAGSVTHRFADGDGTLNANGLKSGAVRELANDVTVTGEREPTVYWKELFQGDGTTVEFSPTGDATALGAGRSALLQDSFTGAGFNRERWQLSDPGSHLSLSGNGLTFNGGNGVDGQTTLAGVDPVEVAGTMVIELAGLELEGSSAGALGGLYGGTTVQANCFAGFNVRHAGGETMVTPMVNGVETGGAYTVLSGHRYTLRLHVHCPEMQRVKQVYYAMVDGAVQAFGGGLVDAPVALVFELRDEGESSNTPVATLYDGVVESSPARVTFVAANCVQLFGSVNAVSVTRTGSVWIESTSGSTGTSRTRLAGAANEGLDCVVSTGTAAKVTFLPGRAPEVDETVQVSYRGSSRAVARLADAGSVAAEAAGGGSGTARWLGKVVRPKARSSADCVSAAQAVLAFSTSREAAVAGSYLATNPNANGDIWPGDVLEFVGEGGNTRVLARAVEILESGAAPEVLQYRIGFANDWAEGLGVELSEAVAEDAEIPETAADAANPGAALANLQGLTVRLGSGGGSLMIDAGTDAPAGGGFEVRRRDAGFGTGTGGSASGDLVLRSPVRGFSIPRAEFEETFFVRMYDGSGAAVYSQASVGIRTHLPIG